MEKGDSFVKQFSKLNKDSLEIAGEKGANLSEIYNNHLPVPTGFVITSNAFEEFMDKSEIREKIKDYLDSINVDEESRINSASEEIRRIILDCELPEEIKEEIVEAYEALGANKYEIERGTALDILNNAYEPVFVAVRSSVPNPTKLKIREQDTYLNLKGSNQILEHVKKCFASLYRPETLYRMIKENSLDSAKIAVVVQKMVNGEKAGKIYSKKDEIKIKAVWGLGEGMNLNDIYPDEYELDLDFKLKEIEIKKKNFAIVRDSSGELKKIKLNEDIGMHQVLEDFEIEKLCNLLKRVEELYDSKVELEFIIKEDDIFLTQAKPLKNVKEIQKNEEKINLEEKKVYFSNKDLKKLHFINLNPVIKNKEELYSFKKYGFKKIGLIKIPEVKQNSEEHKDFLKNYLLEFKEYEKCPVSLSDFLNENEKNPILGNHGIKFLLNNKQHLIYELKNIFEFDSFSEIIIPNLSELEEFEKVNKIIEDNNLQKEVGILIQTPSPLQLMKNFKSKGINHCILDLDKVTQLLLGIDRENESVKEFYYDLPESLKTQLDYLIRVCSRENILLEIYSNTKNSQVFEYFLKNKIKNFISDFENFFEISEILHKIESKNLKENDESPRNYELKKQKEEVISEDLKRDLELIEKEKQEYLKEHPEEE